MAPRESPIECHNCEDCNYTSFQGELWCESCHFTPSGGASTRRFRPRTAWDHWERGRRQAEQRGARPYCVGGVPSTYRGEDEYEVDDEGDFTPPPAYRLRTRHYDL